MARKHYYDRTFSLRDKTARQIELEDIVSWARDDIKYPLSLIPAKKIELSITAAYLFGLGIYKKSLSIMIA